MKTIKACKPLTLKDGTTISKGESFTLRGVLSDTKGSWQRDSDGRIMILRFSSLIKAPSMSTLEKWSENGIAKSVLGARVEPDGHGPDGEPSWMLAMGMI
jgi:hypothetical protein